MDLAFSRSVSEAADGPQQCHGWLLRGGAGLPAWVGLEKGAPAFEGASLGLKGEEGHCITDQRERERDRQARGGGRE